MNKERVSQALAEAAKIIREEFGEVGAIWLNDRSSTNYPTQSSVARIEEGLYRRKMLPIIDLADVLEDVATSL